MLDATSDAQKHCSLRTPPVLLTSSLRGLEDTKKRVCLCVFALKSQHMALLTHFTFPHTLI